MIKLYPDCSSVHIFTLAFLFNNLLAFVELAFRQHNKKCCGSIAFFNKQKYEKMQTVQFLYSFLFGYFSLNKTGSVPVACLYKINDSKKFNIN